MPAKNRTKVFFDALPIALPQYSGIGHVLANTAKALANAEAFNQSYELVLLINPGTRKYLRQSGLENLSVKVLQLKSRYLNALNQFKLLPPVDSILGRGVYIFGNYSNWPLRNSPSITYVHDLSFKIHPEVVRAKVHQTLSKNLGLWMDRTDVVVAVSEHSRQDILKNYQLNSDKVKVIYSGVDPAVFYPRQPAEIDIIKKKYDVSGPYIMFLSNIEPRKNVLKLLNAYEQLPKELSQQYALLLVGSESWLSSEISDKINGLQASGHMIIKPKQFVPEADLPMLLSGASLLVHPAIYEGFGLSPLQAMACGTPVVVANNSSLPEVVGGAGLYIDALDETDIKNNLAKLLTDPSLQRQLAQQGLQQAAKFTWENTADQLIKILNSLIK